MELGSFVANFYECLTSWGRERVRWGEHVEGKVPGDEGKAAWRGWMGGSYNVLLSPVSSARGSSVRRNSLNYLDMMEARLRKPLS
ncbi:hypothetical protein J6590_075686 [Homalodisca vitripennis]|nr:hypothetical protein J6590_075686 [Homalodisca vitripennis]